MSNSELRVRSDDPTAHIKVLDASANVVAEGIGSVAELLAQGFYKIRVRVGAKVEERLVAVDEKPVVEEFSKAEISTPIPVNYSSRSHEYHQHAIRQSFAKPKKAIGKGSKLLIAAREWSTDGKRAHPDPAGQLSIILAAEKKEKRVPFARFANVQREGDAFAIGAIEVDPGLYHVELELPDGKRLRRALHASPRWATQLFMLFRDVGDQRLPDLAAGSVAIATAPVMDDEETRLAELALEALTQRRSILSGQMRDLLTYKFGQPLLGIIGAHLLLREADQAHLVRIVIGNLTGMLGADHPDVQALRAKVEPEAPVQVSEPPLLRASWDLLVEASAARPDLIASGSPAAEIAPWVVPSAAWLVWEPPADKKDTHRVDAKLEVLRSYMQAQSRFAGGTEQESALESLETGPSHLDDSARADLSRALGLPSVSLDNLLKRL